MSRSRRTPRLYNKDGHGQACRKRRGDTMTDGNPGADWSDATRVFDEHRDLLFAVAYRVLGSVTDADDVVQEARLRRVKARRESYVGPWLPEPVLTGHDVAEDVALAESVSVAMLIVLETLTPLERAVFVLREAFGMPHAEIAEILGRKEEAVRQLARRAREHVRERSTRFETDQATHQQVTKRFLEATTGRNLEALMAVLAPGVTLVADGGGRALAPRRPLHGSEEVARFLLAIATESQMARFLGSFGIEPPRNVRVSLAQVNGGPGIVVTSDGRPITAIVLDVAGGVVHTVHLVANPDKLLGVRAIESS